METNKQPKVSILTTVYNREKFLGSCIESVLKSTYTNWEMIIVDDCSTDNSIQIAKQYTNADPRIKLFFNETNLGDYPNRNKAASLAKGKYLKYLDSDDLIYPHCIEIMVNTMEQFPEAGLGVSQQVLEDNLPYPFKLTPHETYKREFFKKGILGFAPTETIIKRDVFNSIGGFSGKRFVGDFELWLKITAQFPMVKVQSGLIYWRKHEGQEFKLGSQTGSYTIANYLCIKEAFQNNSCPLNKHEIKKALQWIDFRHARNTINLCVKKKSPLKALNVIQITYINFFKLIKSFLPWSIYQKL